MSELAVSLLRLSYLLALWLFVLAVVTVLRRDIYGTRITRRDPGRATRRGSGRRARVAAPAVAGVGDLFSPFPKDDAVPPQGSRPRPVGGRGGSPGGLADLPGRLVVVSGPLKGTSLPLGASGVVIGRSSSSNLVLDDEFTSGRHAAIVWDGEGWRLEDLGSTNGTFLGREQITGAVPLRAGQAFRIGQTRLELQR
ncbi:MAG: FHA domain-containing protein [Bifidobacteriaceae bacterium]|jgi:hypothetical protein|nr:FHA domain-containing protein [Bifidobacteriaceae bacterium]